MAVIRLNEIRSMSEKELKGKLVEFDKELTTQYAKIAAGGMPDNPGKLSEMKKVIARIRTIAKEKNYKIDE